MSDFVGYVFSYLRSALILLLPALVLCGLCLMAAARRYRKKYGGQRPFPWRRVIMWLALGAWLAVVLFVTVFRTGHGTWRQINWHLFRAWREAWNDFSEKSWLNVLLNIGMFVPLGILLPLMGNRFRRWPWMLLAGFGTTLGIESVQYILARGLFDVDDLLCNTLGAMIGYFAVMVLLCAVGKKRKALVCHGALLLAVTAGIAGIFVAYGLQEYGNLPDAPAFRVDTSNVEWNLEIKPGTEERRLPIYHLEPPGREACAAFGEAFLKKAGVAAVDLTYFNDVAYLRENQGNRFMEVYYLDGTYEYYDWNDYDPTESGFDETDEQTLRRLLSGFGITVPEEAAFSVDPENRYCFSLDHWVQGDAMNDGTLSCVYNADYGLREIKNTIRHFSHYGDAAVRSEQEAVAQVMAGWISSGDTFEFVEPKLLSVTSCVLSYRVDTKGFYQPVYEIGISAPDGSYSQTVLIPAMA